MGKHWGLQFENRVREFSAEYASSRLYQWGKEGDVIDAKRKLAEVERKVAEACACTAKHEDALAILIEIGPDGLYRLERTTALSGYSVDQFLRAYNGGEKF